MIKEVTTAKGKLELWRMVSDNMWTAIDKQARDEQAAKAARAAAPKPRKRRAGGAKAKSASVPPVAAAPKPQVIAKPAAKPVPIRQQPITKPAASTLPKSLIQPQVPAIAAGIQQAAAGNAVAPTAAKPKPYTLQGGALMARARSAVDAAV